MIKFNVKIDNKSIGDIIEISSIIELLYWKFSTNMKNAKLIISDDDDTDEGKDTRCIIIIY